MSVYPLRGGSAFDWKTILFVEEFFQLALNQYERYPARVENEQNRYGELVENGGPPKSF